MAVRFDDTIPMSTYLVAWVVGPLELTEAVDVDGVPLRVAHVPGKGHLVDFAIEIGAFSLRFFTDYYGIPYPEKKVDFVALPDFAAGAMENLGLITYRESLLLVDPSQATQQELLAVADVVAHELAHMWFGDLVTMRWWNGIWLNEAFATFMANLAVDAFRPDWDRWGSFRRVCSTALEIDALDSTRPIEYPVNSPDDASDMFDSLTYTKGAAVLRMLERYLGPGRFRDGIQRYLKDHAFGNTETSDLWDSIEAATDEPVRRIMDTWIWQGGYPLVTVREDGDALSFAQERFRYDGGDDGTRWEVPLLVRESLGRDAEARAILVEPEGASLRSTRARRCGRGERGGGQLPPRRVRGRAPGNGSGAVPSMRSPPSSGSAWWTTRGPGRWPEAFPPPSSWRLVRGLRRRPTCTCGSRSWPAWAGSTGSLRASPARGSAGTSGIWCGRRSSGWGGSPGRTSPT